MTQIIRKTHLIHTRHAWRSHRSQAAFHTSHGLQIVTIEQLAARLAGGFLQPIDSDDLNTAVSKALSKPLGELDGIKELPGFQRAAAATLSKQWLAGLDLNHEIKTAGNPAARTRFESLIALERYVLESLPKNQLRSGDLVSAALHRVKHADSIFGSIDIHGHTEMAPVWRPLIVAVSKVTKVTWKAEAMHVPDWLHDTGIEVQTHAAEQPSIQTFSCASPRHEVLEAVRWARQHLSRGAGPQDIAIAAASPEAWDDYMLAVVEAANLPIHFAHGKTALSTFEGQLAAALAEVMLRGFSRMRIIRLVALLRPHNPRFNDLPGNWWQLMVEDAPLLTDARWQKAIDAMPPERFPNGVDPRPILTELIETLSMGLTDVDQIGERLLNARALSIWQKALSQGPAAALDVTLAGLRVDDGLEPEASILWAPASAVAAMPRPLTWMVGLTSRSWPRRAAEDPLLPDHIVESARLNPLPVHQADRRDFATILAMTAGELVCSRARRDSEGRLNGISPLYPRHMEEIHLAQSREPEHAAGPTDRLFARPDEFSTLPVAHSARSAWIDWHIGKLTAHDGLVRPNHPLLLKALDRRQSASSLVKLLRDPLGYLWTYGFRWSEPEETDEPLTLDALSFGNLIHEILQEAVTRLEADSKGGFAKASDQRITQAVRNAAQKVAAFWDDNRPVPPPAVLQRKCEEAVELAITALLSQQEPLPDQRSWAEIPFGGDKHAQDLDEETVRTLPWDPFASVVIADTDIAIGGSIDRLDLSADGSLARVTDYKTGKRRGKPPQLKRGAELQRCLYAYAVTALLSTKPSVEAQLLYPRQGGNPLKLADPVATLEKLSAFLKAAEESFKAGLSLPGPAAQETWYDLAFALPGGAKESYLDNKMPLVAQSLSEIAPLWDEE